MTAKDSTSKFLLRKLDIAVRRKFYLRQGISLVGLADELGTNRTYLSDLIHEHYGVSFSDFVNGLRIEEAKRIMMEANGDVMVLDFYEKIGFVSCTTFFRSFKKVTGMGTTDWMRQNIPGYTIPPTPAANQETTTHQETTAE